MRRVQEKKMLKQTGFLRSVVCGAVLLLAACATTPTTTPTLDQARSEFVHASNDANVAKYAPVEFRDATAALDRANAAAAQRESLDTIDKLAYLAKQKIETAENIARTKAAEADIAHARQERTEVQLQARTAEAERARADAASAQADAAAAQAQAQTAQQQADAARQQAADAQAQTQALAEHAARLEAILVELHAVKTERGYVVTIGDILFDTDKATLKPDGMANLRKLAEAMTQNPDRTVLVEGFTDSTGTAAHNQDLSQRRADSVAMALTGMGVPRERVTTRAYGQKYPVAPNDNASNRQRNRRVEIVLSNDGAPIPPRAAMR
jgi:outer membrane protein OmpA-like peptidoglycan-associated protein